MQEDGFHFTMNIGQVLQILGFIIPAFIIWGKLQVKDALHGRDMAEVKKQLSAQDADIAEIKNTLRQLPQTLVSFNRLTGNRMPIPAMSPEESENAFEELVQKAAERLREMGAHR